MLAGIFLWELATQRKVAVYLPPCVTCQNGASPELDSRQSCGAGRNAEAGRNQVDGDLVRLHPAAHTPHIRGPTHAAHALQSVGFGWQPRVDPGAMYGDSRIAIRNLSRRH